MDALFLLALALTVAVEIPVLIAGIHVLKPEPRPPLSKILFAGVFASSWSLPYLWFLIPDLISGWLYLPVGELLVTLGESLVFWFVLELRYAPCLILSVACNGSSFIAGLLLAQVM